MTVLLRCRGSLILAADLRLMISIIYTGRNFPVYYFQALEEIRKHYLSSSD